MLTGAAGKVPRCMSWRRTSWLSICSINFCDGRLNSNISTTKYRLNPHVRIQNIHSSMAIPQFRGVGVGHEPTRLTYSDPNLASKSTQRLE
jgi:hypothetical protein